MATKKTKENKTTKAKKTKTTKAKSENAEVVVAKVEPNVESVTVDVTIHQNGEVTGGTVSTEQVETPVESVVCVENGSDKELINAMTEGASETVDKEEEPEVTANFNEDTKEIDFTINEEENNEVTVGVDIETIVDEKDEKCTDLDYTIECDENQTLSVSSSENLPTTVTEEKEEPIVTPEEPVTPEKKVKKKKRGIFGSVYKWFGAQIDL